jgi:hypothetical protein
MNYTPVKNFSPVSGLVGSYAPNSGYIAASG